jgi:hypothetical protein
VCLNLVGNSQRNKSKWPIIHEEVFNIPLTGSITGNETEELIKIPPIKKSPGLDVFTAEFYETS